MKKIYTLFVLTFLFCQQIAFAQDAEGCDGERYYYDVFDSFTKTTEVYGTNLTADSILKTLRIDVFQPVADVVEKRPLMILAHGGAFVGGERADMNPLCEIYAKKGFVTATMTYRLHPISLGIPDSIGMLDAAIKAIGDMRAVVRYFRKDAATENKFKIDPDRIFVGGGSAGAIMAVQVAYLDSLDNIPSYFDDILSQNGGIEGNTGDADNQSYPSDVQGVFNLAGAIHKLDWLDNNTIPIMSYHGDLDDVVPYGHGPTNVLGFDFMSVNGSGSINNYINAQGLDIPNILTTAPGADHSTAFGSEYEEYLESFTDDAQLFLYDLLCQGVALDVNELLLKEGFQAFPNPSNHVVTFDLSGLEGGNFDLSVYDVAGKHLFQDRLQKTKTYQLKKSQIGKGLFFVKIQTEKGTKMQKIIFE